MDRPRRLPFVEVLRSQPREVLLSSGSLVSLFAFLYMGTSYLISYGTNPDGVGLSRPDILGINVGTAVVFGVATALAGVVSDRYGRRTVIVASCAIGIVWGLLLFPLVATGTAVSFAIGVSVTLSIVGVCYGPVGSFLPELFAPQHRYTGAGLAYNIAGIVGGALPPLIAPALVASFGGIGIGIMLSTLAVLSLACTLGLRETRGVPLAHDASAGVRSRAQI